MFISCKIFSENAIFGKGKCIQAVWLPRNSFYGKSILVFGSFKHFTENAFRFTENQFPCLVRLNILRKMEFVFYGKSIPMFGLRIILRKIWNALQIQALALPRQTCIAFGSIYPSMFQNVVRLNFKVTPSNWHVLLALLLVAPNLEVLDLNKVSLR